MSSVFRIDTVGRLDGKSRTPQGGYRVDANLTRTGVFLYRNADGQTVREYRPPEEVFNEDSLETLKYAPVTVGHPAMVKPANWKTLSVGVVGTDARADGKFVAGSVVVQDEEAISKIDRDELVEISMGYSVKLDHTPGVTPDGEPYDAIQRGITYNHAALLPRNTGRAGIDVRLRLDSNGDVVDPYREAMTFEELKKRADAAEGERDALKSENAKLTSENEKLRKDADDAKVAAEKARTDAIDLLPALVQQRASLESSAKNVLGAEEDLSKKTDSEVIAAVIVKDDPEFKVDGRSADYLRARFDGIVERSTRQDAAHRKVAEVTNAGNSTEKKSRLDEALDKADAEMKQLREAGPPPGALTRK